MITHCAYFQFYKSLNDFLPSEKRNIQFSYSFKGIASVKNLIEAIGVPHPEVAYILVNKKKVNFNYHVKDNDKIEIFPFNYKEFSLLKKIYLFFKKNNHIKFIIDVHLGKLAKYLRICGFDTAYNWKWDDRQIIEKSTKEDRIILTHDIQLLKNKNVSKGYWIRSLDPEKQIVEVIKRYNLIYCIHSFKRCLHCNHLITKIQKKLIKQIVEDVIYNKYHRFYYCHYCEKIYWKGHHYDNMRKFIKNVKNNVCY